ncbi:hypothetical protein D9V86_12090 [Bacteroidetes/Chlorobi group bacterium ChocPot_Mid]|nr:MAG: hypothetical protein D9V86_12090 [Bacteroidetes/Chlorobi group bacterium ChocPot_Mid]
MKKAFQYCFNFLFIAVFIAILILNAGCDGQNDRLLTKKKDIHKDIYGNPTPNQYDYLGDTHNEGLQYVLEKHVTI